MECAIILTHLSFLLLAIYEDTDDTRQYFELTSFFSIVLCILIEFIFNIIDFFIDFIKFIISLFRKKEEEDTKKGDKKDKKGKANQKKSEKGEKEEKEVKEEFQTNKRLKFSSYVNQKREIQKISENKQVKIHLIIRDTSKKENPLDNKSNEIEPVNDKNDCLENENNIEEEKK